MRVLRDAQAIQQDIDTCLDPHLAARMSAHLQFLLTSDEGGLTVVVVEPGDTLQTLDAHFERCFPEHPFGGRRLGDVPGFMPFYESLEAYPTFYEVFFVVWEQGISLLIPRTADIDPTVLAFCAEHSVPAPASS